MIIQKMIPKKIFQTFETSQLPMGMAKACLSWKTKNPNYEYTFFNKYDRLEFIKKHFNRDVLQAYLTLIPGAFKADLWRYCVLYINGGVYIDADTICEMPLDKLIEGNDHFIITRDDPMSNKFLGNAFIATIPNSPILKECIDRIVEKCKHKQLEFYLDYTGPALMGKVVNKVSRNVPEETDYELGKDGNLKIMKHDFGRTKYTHNGQDVLHVEYPGKVAEMDSIGNKKFWDYIQAETVFRHIPHTLLYTSYDKLDVNAYMVDSFKKHNPEYELKYFDQIAVDAWFKNSIYNDAYQKLTERGERTDFFRYCYLYENGGVYADTDIFFNRPINDWLIDQDMVVGLEALVDKQQHLGFDQIGVHIGDKIASVANWFIAIKPKHPVLSAIINDIIHNKDNRGVLQNTGPGRFSKHIIPHFGLNNDFTKDIRKDNDELLSINRFGSNQSHSGAKKYNDPFNATDEDIYITHMFAGTWRDTTPQHNIQTYKTEYCSHNLSLIKIVEGYKGIARLDELTDRTKFMKELGDCRSLYEFYFDHDLTLKDVVSRNIDYPNVAKFEDFRSFSYKNKMYHSVAYIDTDWNTRIGILDNEYKFIKNIEVEELNRMGFGVPDTGEVIWEKNWLFFMHDNELHFIYNTSPNYVVYKHKGDFEFEKIIDVPNHLHHKFPKDELYFSARVKVGGSTPPIWFEEQQCYIYMVHTKLYEHRCYNHWLIKLDKNLNIIDISHKPFINRHIPYALFFVSMWLDDGDHVLLSGGLEDNTNFTWRIPKSKVHQCFS